MIVITDKMKKPVNYDSVQFILEFGSVKRGIFADRFYAYEKVAGKNLAFTVVKGDYICKIVVLKILHIYIKDVVVRTENDVHIAESLQFAAGNELQPAVIGKALPEIKLDVFVKIPDH